MPTVNKRTIGTMYIAEECSPGEWRLRGYLIEAPSHTVAAISKASREVNPEQASADAVILTNAKRMLVTLLSIEEELALTEPNMGKVEALVTATLDLVDTTPKP